MFSASLSHITAGAVVPEQLAHYVRAVSGRRARLVGDFAAYTHERHTVLVAYPGAEQTGQWQEQADSLAKALEKNTDGSLVPPPAGLYDVSGLGQAIRQLEQSSDSLTVLAPFIPPEAPNNADITVDCYWQLSLPPQKSGQKLRNMLARAGRELTLGQESWGQEHQALVHHYLQTRPLSPGTRAIFTALPAYAGMARTYAEDPAGSVLILSARGANNTLAGFAIGDFSGLHTAFYMFSFRRPDAPPGTADLLLSGLVRHAQSMGHQRMNLGLGINSGIGFFKKKWGASPWLPYVETSWNPGGSKSGSEYNPALRFLKDIMSKFLRSGGTKK